jgi:hypothetical protein
MRLALLAALALLLAGCSSPPASTAPTSTSGSATQAAKLNATLPKLVQSVAYLNDTGNTGVGFGGCVFVPTPTCEFPDQPVPGKSDFELTLPPGNVTAFDVTVTWQSTTPQTATLAVGAMVMNECDGCNETFLGELAGTSPLHFTMDGLAAPLQATQVVHFYVYNAGGAVAHPSVPGFAYATVDQAFAFAGKVTVERKA